MWAQVDWEQDRTDGFERHFLGSMGQTLFDCHVVQGVTGELWRRTNQDLDLLKFHAQYCDFGQSLPISELVPHVENGNNSGNNNNIYSIEL